MQKLEENLAVGPFPETDGWRWLYRAFEQVAPAGQFLRRVVCHYFWPTALERWRSGWIYRLLGVHLVGAVIPTGGIVIRRVFRARMAPYTLSGTSVGGARSFYYRTCVFETLHMPFFLALAALAIHRFATGRIDLALENAGINLAINFYPMLHHRRTRTRIVKLLHDRGTRQAQSRRGTQSLGKNL
ncbi:MAG: hypothetical protein OER90_03105 [Gemmatimonadota bacterium]|nr:hypothetical protein [Gemmatimonadota bacterium]